MACVPTSISRALSTTRRTFWSLSPSSLENRCASIPTASRCAAVAGSRCPSMRTIPVTIAASRSTPAGLKVHVSGLSTMVLSLCAALPLQDSPLAGCAYRPGRHGARLTQLRLSRQPEHGSRSCQQKCQQVPRQTVFHDRPSTLKPSCGKSLAIRACQRQRMECVDNRDNSALDWNLTVHQTRGVAATVDPFAVGRTNERSR